MFEPISSTELDQFWSHHGTDCDDMALAKYVQTKTLQEVVKILKGCPHKTIDVPALIDTFISVAKDQDINLEITI